MLQVQAMPGEVQVLGHSRMPVVLSQHARAPFSSIFNVQRSQ